MRYLSSPGTEQAYRERVVVLLCRAGPEAFVRIAIRVHWLSRVFAESRGFKKLCDTTMVHPIQVAFGIFAEPLAFLDPEWHWEW